MSGADVDPDALAAAYELIAGELFDDISAVLGRVDDVTVNATPDVDGVNSVFALVTHIDGMVGYWLGSLVAGHDIPRDRAAEFVATGTVAQARELVAQTRTRVADWLPVALHEGIRNPSAVGTTRRDAASSTPEFVLLHVLREIAQHVGHLQVCADVVAR
ncbi:DinB family protein [Gordonia sp. TBRC 11910]|uniref:DinB family protein n=1 Tax=Gordonia asplenii TaxID=2725283 RepID=A0A848KSL8_9ACTN|nr:DinB family protein [Gordonia asplenii]NMO01139.1 DinB family protein [Gordonia asplenii]